MFEIILHQPEIPPNTGNIMRLCGNTGCRLHLVEPLGFTLETKALRRAGLDYRDLTEVVTHRDLEHCLASLMHVERRLFLFTTRGDEHLHDRAFRAGDAFLFGAESCGVPETVHADRRVTARLRLPMVPGSRSLNLSNTVAVVVYEAWRQCGLAGAATRGSPENC